MKTSNNVSQTQLQSESGMAWEEKITNGQGSVEVLKCGSFRVRATGATTVAIDGVLAATMSTGEILIFNVGDGNPDDTKTTVTVTIAAANAFVQVARSVKRQSLV